MENNRQIVFIMTDIINEYYGKNGVKKLTFITASLIAYAFVVLFCEKIMYFLCSGVSNDSALIFSSR